MVFVSLWKFKTKNAFLSSNGKGLTYSMKLLLNSMRYVEKIRFSGRKRLNKSKNYWTEFVFWIRISTQTDFPLFSTNRIRKKNIKTKKKKTLTIRQRYLEFHMRRSQKALHYGSLSTNWNQFFCDKGALRN